MQSNLMMTDRRVMILNCSSPAKYQSIATGVKNNVSPETNNIFLSTANWGIRYRVKIKTVEISNVLINVILNSSEKTWDILSVRSLNLAISRTP